MSKENNMDFGMNVQLSDEDMAFLDQKPKKKRAPSDGKMALISMDGTAITEHGALVKHNWLSGLEFEADKYTDLVFTPEEMRALANASRKIRTGASIFSVMICAGRNRCPRSETCPFVEMQIEIDKREEKRNVVPVGRRCPVELDIMRQAAMDLAEEFQLDDNVASTTHKKLILELAEQEVLESRMNALLSTGFPDLSEEKIVSIMTDQEGITTENRVKDIADAYRVKEKCQARKDKLRKELIASPFVKKNMESKLGVQQGDPSQTQADLLRMFYAMQRKLEGNPIEDAEFEDPAKKDD